MDALFLTLVSIPVLIGAGIVAIPIRGRLRDWRERNLSSYGVGWWVLLSLSVGLLVSLKFNWFHVADQLQSYERLSETMPQALLVWGAIGGFFGLVLALLTTRPTTISIRERPSNMLRYAVTVGLILFVTAVLAIYVSSAFR